MKNIVNLSLHCMLIIVALFSSHSMLVDISWLLYGVQLCMFIARLKSANNSLIYISPSVITILYVGLNFTLGEFLVSRGIGLNKDFYKLLMKFEHLNYITAFFLVCNLLIFLSIPKSYYDYDDKIEKSEKAPEKSTFAILIGLFCAINALNFFSVNLSAIGGAGNFNYPIQLALIIPFAFLLAAKKNVSRFIVYVVTIGMFTVFHFSSKREIMYIAMSFIFCEVIVGNIRLDFSLKKILLYTFMITAVIYIILLSSILRGYGNYNVSGPLEAMQYVPVYVQEDFFLNSFSSNIEASGVFTHAANSANLVLSGKEDLLWGSTLAKVLFLPIPRSVFPAKPQSMIDIYTTIYAPSFRNIGGSYPILVYSELLWNFYLFCLPLIFLFYRWFNRQFFKALMDFKQRKYSFKGMSVFYLLITLIQYVRGSGLELWLIYYIVAIPVFVILARLLKQQQIEPVAAPGFM